MGVASLSLLVAIAGCGRVWFDPLGGSQDGPVLVDGVVQGGTQVTNDTIADTFPAIAWSGTDLALVWIHAGAPNEVRFARFDRTGQRLSPDTVVGPQYPFITYGPRVAWGGTQWGVVWDHDTGGAPDNSQIFLALVNAQGTLAVGPNQISNGPSHSYECHLTWDGNQFGVEWTDIRDGNHEQYYAAVDSLGTTIVPDTRLTNTSGITHGGSLAWTGSMHGLSYTDPQGGGNNIFFQGLWSTGAPAVNPKRMTMGAASDLSSLAWGPGHFGLVWTDAVVDTEIYFVAVDPAGAQIGNVVVTAMNQVRLRNPALVWTGVDFALAYLIQNGSVATLMLHRMDGNGLAQQSAQVAHVLSSAPRLAAVGNDGTVALTWSDGAEIYLVVVPP